MEKEHPYRSWWPALLAAAAWCGCAASAETVMTVTGPVISTGDYISNGSGVLEKRWRYDITNTSSSGDINNMIIFQINAGTDNGLLGMDLLYDGFGIINLFSTAKTSGFTGLLPPQPGENFVQIYLITPATTPSAPGLATARAFGVGGIEPPFPSVAVAIPYLAAGQTLASATQAVGGQHEFRYRMGNAGTPALSSLTVPAGWQQGVSATWAP